MRRDKSPVRAAPPPASPKQQQPVAAYDVAVVLLHLGTVPFVVAVLVLNIVSFSAPDKVRLLSCVLSYSVVILAFIGGLQQAAAVASSSEATRPSQSPLVVAAIGLALGGWVTLTVSQYRGVAPADFLVMSSCYAAQACLEAMHPRWQQLPQRVLMPKARRVPMLVAAVSLAAAAHAAALIAPFSLGRTGTAFTPAELALLALSAALIAAAVLPRSPTPRLGTTKFAHVAVGSTNAAKCAAVRQTLQSYPAVAPADALLSFSVSTGVDEQPIGLEVTAEGARNRAVAAHAEARRLLGAGGVRGAVLAFGIESGIFEVDGAYYDVCFVSAYNGVRHHLGLSCAFEVPPKILDFMLKQGMDMSQASNASGISSDPKLGSGQGLIGILSRGRIRRLEYTVQAITNALFFAENDGWYK